MVEPQDAVDRLERGDIILWNGRPRTVRSVHREINGRAKYFRFAILRQSWTNRPYTVMTASDVRNGFGGRIARRKDDLCSTDTECRVQKDIDSPSGRRGIYASQMVGKVW